MAYLKHRCTKCDKPVEVLKEFRAGTFVRKSLSCGHTEDEYVLDAKTPIDNSPSQSGKTMYPFQEEAVRFALAANARCLFADEMRLGKTVEALRTLTSAPERLIPAAIFCKSALRLQWMCEILDWCGDSYMPQIIYESRNRMIKGFKTYLFSLDMLRRFNGGLVEEFKRIAIKTIIIDECQQVKNPTSQRTKAVKELVNVTPHLLPTSGTPIKNNAGEYFSILNMLNPGMFRTYQHFLWHECQMYNDKFGRPRIGGLRDPKGFAEKTKHFIIRRERKDVMPELPQINRTVRLVELEQEDKTAYNNQHNAFLDFLDGLSPHEQPTFAVQSSAAGHLAKMRHIAGLAKVQPAIDWVEEFLLSTEDKVLVFCHHIDVAELIFSGVSKTCTEMLGILPPVQLKAGKVAEEALKFSNNPKIRVAICSTLAAGEGLNLPQAGDDLMVERQWNPANEEQAECRMVGISHVKNQVNSTYLIAAGTSDEYLTEIVEHKRRHLAKTYGKEAVPWNESEIMKELIQKIRDSGRRR